MPEPIEGYVRARGRIAHALKIYSQGRWRVARYFERDGEGVWCGEKVASTFFEHPWNMLNQQQLEEKIAFIAEVNRLVKPLSGWGQDNFSCMICGAKVSDQFKHYYWHTDPDGPMRRTLEALFGGN